MTIILPGKHIWNAPQELVHILFGGEKPVQEVAQALEVHDQTIYDAMRVGYFRSRQLALKASELSAAKGAKIPAAELAGLDQWRGGGRHPELSGGTRRRAGKRPNGGGGRLHRTCAPSAPPIARLVGSRSA